MSVYFSNQMLKWYLLITNNYIRFISSRFAQPQKRRAILSFTRMVALLSVMIGSIALIMSLSILEGFDLKLRDSAYRFTSHIHIKSFSEIPFGGKDENANMIMEKYDFVDKAKPTLQKEGLVRAGKNLEGVVVNGFDFDRDITGFSGFITQGVARFSNLSANEVIIGSDLAEMLGVTIDDKMILYVILKEGSTGIPDSKIRKLTVKGIYQTGMTQYDKTMIYVPFEMLQSLIGFTKEQCTGFDVTLHNASEAPIKALILENELGYPFYCQSVQQIHRSLFAWIDLQKEPIPLVLGLISIVAVLNIITMLLITVVEKTKNIGILRALGMKGKNILGIFIMQGLKVSLIGTITGLGVSFLFSVIQLNYSIIKLDGAIYFLNAMPIKIIPEYYAAVFAISMLLGFLSTIIPAIIAIKVSPLQAIRYK
jgi:lipoprotein-releasing system permease protein